MDWRNLIYVGLHRLGLTPDVFWQLTPAELAIMIGVGPETQPLSRARLDELLTAFPDIPRTKGG